VFVLFSTNRKKYTLAVNVPVLGEGSERNRTTRLYPAPIYYLFEWQRRQRLQYGNCGGFSGAGQYKTGSGLPKPAQSRSNRSLAARPARTSKIGLVERWAATETQYHRDTPKSNHDHYDDHLPLVEPSWRDELGSCTPKSRLWPLHNHIVSPAFHHHYPGGSVPALDVPQSMSSERQSLWTCRHCFSCAHYANRSVRR
jgi:hypothetical protein